MILVEIMPIIKIPLFITDQELTHTVFNHKAVGMQRVWKSNVRRTNEPIT